MDVRAADAAHALLHRGWQIGSRCVRGAVDKPHGRSRCGARRARRRLVVAGVQPDCREDEQHASTAPHRSRPFKYAYAASDSEAIRRASGAMRRLFPVPPAANPRAGARPGRRVSGKFRKRGWQFVPVATAPDPRRAVECLRCLLPVGYRAARRWCSPVERLVASFVLDACWPPNVFHESRTIVPRISPDVTDCICDSGHRTI